MGLQGQLPTGIATGAGGSLFSKEVLTTIPATLTFVPAAGSYASILTGADIVMEVQDSTGVWRQVGAAGITLSHFETDGTNIRFRNPAAVAENISLIKQG